MRHSPPSPRHSIPEETRVQLCHRTALSDVASRALAQVCYGLLCVRSVVSCLLHAVAFGTGA